eukprot:8280327-Pyramimonas_sp.AAC.1
MAPHWRLSRQCWKNDSYNFVKGRYYSLSSLLDGRGEACVGQTESGGVRRDPLTKSAWVP